MLWTHQIQPWSISHQPYLHGRVHVDSSYRYKSSVITKPRHKHSAVVKTMLMMGGETAEITRDSKGKYIHLVHRVVICFNDLLALSTVQDSDNVLREKHHSFKTLKKPLWWKRTTTGRALSRLWLTHTVYEASGHLMRKSKAKDIPPTSHKQRHNNIQHGIEHW